MFPSDNSIAGEVKFQEDTDGDARHDVNVPPGNKLPELCLFENVFISPSFLKDSFVGYRILG